MGNNMEAKSPTALDPKKNLYQEIRERYLNCALCNTQLSFKYSINFLSFKVQEGCDCPQCGVKLREQEFTLN